MSTTFRILKYWRELIIVCMVVYIAVSRRSFDESLNKVEKTKISTIQNTVLKKKIVSKKTTTTKPSGETVVIEEKVEESTKEKTKKTDKVIVKQTPAVPKTKWSVEAWYPVTADFDFRRPNVELGRRILNSDTWALVGWENASNSIYVGVRFEL